MSHYQGSGGAIIHLPASTHATAIHNYGSVNHPPVSGNRSSHPPISGNNRSSIHPPISGNLSNDSREVRMEAGQMVMTTTSANAANNRPKPDIAVIFSIISFLVWVRLFQAMFSQTSLGHLEGWGYPIMFCLLVLVPAVTLTCFYFRSDDYQRRFRM